MNIYDPKTMMEAVNQSIPTSGAMRALAFSNEKTVTTTGVVVDTKDEGRKLGYFVHRNAQAVVVAKSGHRTDEYTIPLMRMKMSTTAIDAAMRSAGESFISAVGTIMSPGERALRLMTDNLTTLKNMIDRRIEWMVCQVLSFGKVRCVGDGVDETVDFLRAPTHQIELAGADLWTAPTTCKPIQVIGNATRLARRGGASPRHVVMSSNTFDTLLASNEVRGVAGGAQSLFSQVALQAGFIKPEVMNNNLTYVGRLTLYGVDLWVYDELYDSGLPGVGLTPMLQDGRIVVFSDVPGAQKLVFGAVPELDQMVVAPVFSKVFEEQDPSSRWLLCASAPLPMPTMVNSMVSVKVY